MTRLLRGEVLAAAIHYHAVDLADANPRALHRLSGLHDGVLIAFGKREQGLLVAPGNPRGLASLEDALAQGARFAMRQTGAGAQMLLDVLLERRGVRTADVTRLNPPCLTGPDLANAIAHGEADCGVATRSAAKAARLDFVPLLFEHFDLAMRQADFFRPPIQKLMATLRGERLRAQALDLTGYDVSAAGQVRSAL